MEEFEVVLLARFPINVGRICIALANETEVVGILQFLDGVWVTSKLFVEVLDRAHVCRSPMHHLLFAVAPNRPMSGSTASIAIVMSARASIIVISM